MSCYDLSPSWSCGVQRPQPLAESGNEPCVRQCPDSTALIQPPAVVLTFPGPILSSFPQDSVVGSAGAPVLAASGAWLASGGFGGSGGLYGYGGYGYGGLGALGSWGGYRGLYGSGRFFGSAYCSPYSSSWSGRYGRGFWGSC
ncbi:KRSC protein, partial [Zosterops hypoxanthus]|nr:KRSC protein [Zosterops hypoxanthus]